MYIPLKKNWIECTLPDLKQNNVCRHLALKALNNHRSTALKGLCRGSLLHIAKFASLYALELKVNEEITSTSQLPVQLIYSPSILHQT